MSIHRVTPPRTCHTPPAIQNYSPGSCGNPSLESLGFVQTSPLQQLSTLWPIRDQNWVSLFCSKNSSFSMQLDMRRGVTDWYGKECTGNFFFLGGGVTRLRDKCSSSGDSQPHDTSRILSISLGAPKLTTTKEVERHKPGRCNEILNAENDHL